MAQKTEKFAFRMVLNPGMADEYRRRHDAVFPGIVAALKAAGVSDYSIWLDPETHHLFAILTRTVPHGMDSLPELAAVKEWWAYMADVMATEPDNAPVQVPLVQMFHLP